MKVRKAVIPCAGMGTRFLPFTKAMPKEMISVVDKPALQYIVEECVKAGISEILIIDNSNKFAIEKHFSKDTQMEEFLEQRGKLEEANKLKDISSLAHFSYVKQEFPSGSATAVKLAKNFVGNEPFALLFGDDLIYNEESPAIGQLMDAFEKYGKTVLGVQKVTKENISKYGSIRIVGQEGKVYFIDDVIEKPKAEEAPSLVAALGRYIVTPDVFEYIDKTALGVGNEFGITDTFELMAKDGKVIACEYEGRRYDTGNKSSYLEAVVDYALRDDELKEDFAKFLKERVKTL